MKTLRSQQEKMLDMLTTHDPMGALMSSDCSDLLAVAQPSRVGSAFHKKKLIPETDQGCDFMGILPLH